MKIHLRIHLSINYLFINFNAVIFGVISEINRFRGFDFQTRIYKNNVIRINVGNGNYVSQFQVGLDSLSGGSGSSSKEHCFGFPGTKATI